MNEKEIFDLLINSCESNRGKYAPWWEVTNDGINYSYEIFSEEEVACVTEYADKCTDEMLAANIGNFGLSVFHLLVWGGFYDAVKNAVKRGFNVNIQAVEGQGIVKDTCVGVTPLMIACYRGNFDMAKILLENGADENMCDNEDRNVYHYLAYPYIKNMSNAYQISKNTLEQRKPIADLMSGNVNQKNKEGYTPLENMLFNDNNSYTYALTATLIEKGAVTDMIDEQGNSLLMIAIKNNHNTAALKLMECSELINKQNNCGMTPLHMALTRYNFGLCMALLDKKADKNIADSDGKTPKDMALEKNDENYKALFTSGRIKLNELSRLTGNAFAGRSDDDKDGLSVALYMANKLVREIDEDDDEELYSVIGMLHNALVRDEKCQVLDVISKAGIDFTMPIHRGGGVECIRDYCIGGNFGIKVINKLVELGIDINEPVIKGKTPANIVASLQKRTMMFGNKKDDYYEKAGVFFSLESMECIDNNGTSAMHEAAKNNHTEMLKVMIEKGADVNITQDEPSDAGSTPLHIACSYGNADTVKLLMESGADDSIQNVKGETPAHLAVMKKRFGGDLKAEERAKVLETLSNVDIADNNGRTPLMLLQYLGINDIMDILPIFIDKGADVNHADNAGNTALILTTYNQSYKGIVKELVRAGADVNMANADGNTALHFALMYGDTESGRFMIKKGADYNQANNKGVTPMQIAVEKGYDTILELMDM